MSFNLRDEILKLTDTAPVIKDVEDPYSDDETKAKISEYQKELDFDEEQFGNRRIRPGIGDLSEYGKRYKGKSTSRKDLDLEDIDKDEEDEDEDDDEDDALEGEDDDEEELDDEDEEEEDGGDDDDEDDEIDGEEEEEREVKKKPAKKTSEDDEHELKLVNADHQQDIAKGKAVKSQLHFWDVLVEGRVKMQNLLNTVNQFPQFDYFNDMLKNIDFDFKSDPTTKENQALLSKAINQLIELQQRLLLTDPEKMNILKDLSLNPSSSTNGASENKSGSKRKRAGSEGSSIDSNEEEAEDEIDGEDDKLDDEDDEEIYSDTDEEMQAQERKSKAKKQKITDFKYQQIKPENIEDYLAKFNKSFQKYRDSTIQKWYDKTRLTTGKSFAALEKPILQQIEHILMDRDRIIKRTQLKRGDYKICGRDLFSKPSSGAEIPDLVDLNDRRRENQHLKDYDEEIFDDQDFYNQLLRELIDRRSSNISDPIELSRRSIELQKMRIKTKKKVDTKASKGRKIKFDVHKPMVNFMAPIYRSKMPDEARNELFRSLFGNHLTFGTNGNKSGIDADLDMGGLLFRGSK